MSVPEKTDPIQLPASDTNEPPGAPGSRQPFFSAPFDDHGDTALPALLATDDRTLCTRRPLLPVLSAPLSFDLLLAGGEQELSSIADLKHVCYLQ